MYTMEYYLTQKKVLKFAGKCMQLEENCECGNTYPGQTLYVLIYSGYQI